MAERRQAARRDPIEVALDDGRVFTAQPLPWMVASDLGNAILRQNLESVNNSVHLFMEDNVPQLEMELVMKIKDWAEILDLAFPDYPREGWATLTSDEAADLILAALEVNHLEHMKHLVDPNSPAPMSLGGIDISQDLTQAGLGPKIESTPDSSSEDSPEPPSSL